MQVHWSQTEKYYLTQILKFDFKVPKMLYAIPKYILFEVFEKKLSRKKKKNSQLRVFRNEFCTQKLNFAYKKKFFENVFCLNEKKFFGWYE